MTSTFSIRGSNITIAKNENVTHVPILPGGNYDIRFNQQMGFFYLEKLPNYTLDFKLYDNLESKADRILNTFLDRPFTTGVLLNGIKGTGKSLLARCVCFKAAAMGIPTLLVGAPFAGSGFNDFIGSISQPAILFFDEFEKIYSNSRDLDDEGSNQGPQEGLLSLFDGTVQTKKLMLTTVNEMFRVGDYFKNRPGRMYYNYEFSGLSEAAVREFTQDNLKYPEKVEDVVQLRNLFTNLTYDMLRAVIEEMNRYGEGAKEVMRVLNVRPGFDSRAYYLPMATRKEDGKRFKGTNGSLSLEPFNGGFSLEFAEIVEKEEVPQPAQPEGNDPFLIAATPSRNRGGERAYLHLAPKFIQRITPEGVIVYDLPEFEVRLIRDNPTEKYLY